MAAYTIKVEADLTGTTAVGSARTWTDVTASVLSTGVGSAIEIENWRPDQWTDISPSTLDIVVDNTAGTFKPGATGIKPLSSYWRVSSTISGVQTFLFDGVLTSAVAGWVGGTKAITTIKCVDILALFGDRTPLRSFYAEEVLVDSPLAFYALGEDSDSTSFGDLVSNTAAPFANSKYGAATATAGTDIANAVIGTGVTFANGTITGPQTVVALPVSAVPGVGAWSMEAWIVTTANPGVGQTIVEAVSPDSTRRIAIGTAGTNAFAVPSAGSSVSGTVTANDGKPHHIVGTYDGATLSIYYDGTLQASAARSSTSFTPSAATVGGSLNYGNTLEYGFTGTVAGVALYSTALSSTRVLAHYNAGKTAFAGESTDARITRLLTYRANFGSSLDTGVGVMGTQDTTGVTLADALLACGKAELGVVYVNGSAQVAFRNRSRLFNPATALTLNASNAGEVTPDVEPRIDNQGIVNDATISRPNGADQRAFDQTSINLYGTNDGSDTRIVNSDKCALDIAHDIVAQNKTPLVDTQSVTCDVNAITTVATAQSVLARIPLDRVTVTNLPTTSPAIDGIVQGRHVTIGADKTFTVTFNLSPLRLPVMVADDATLGICDTVNVAAF